MSAEALFKVFAGTCVKTGSATFEYVKVVGESGRIVLRRAWLAQDIFLGEATESLVLRQAQGTIYLTVNGGDGGSRTRN